MDEATTIYAKTELGHGEISTRALHLPARLRAVLIMIDGKHPIGDFLANHPAPDEVRSQVASLTVACLMHLVNVQPEAEPSSLEAESPEAESSPPQIVTVSVEEVNLPKLRQAIGHALVDMIGPDADFFMARVDKAASVEAI